MRREGSTGAGADPGRHRCAPPAWLNEQQLARLPGWSRCRSSPPAGRAYLGRAPPALSDILHAIARIGYQAHPYDPGRTPELLERERRLHLRAPGGAPAYDGMQVMILARRALYFGAESGMENHSAIFHGMSLLLTIPCSPMPAGRSSSRPGATSEPARRHGRAGGARASSSPSSEACGRRPRAKARSIMTRSSCSCSSCSPVRSFELAARAPAQPGPPSAGAGGPGHGHAPGPGRTPKSVPVAELEPGDAVLIRPGSRCRPTASCSRGARAWTNACSPAKAGRWRAPPATRVVGGRSTSKARSP